MFSMDNCTQYAPHLLFTIYSTPLVLHIAAAIHVAMDAEGQDDQDHCSPTSPADSSSTEESIKGI